MKYSPLVFILVVLALATSVRAESARTKTEWVFRVANLTNSQVQESNDAMVSGPVALPPIGWKCERESMIVSSAGVLSAGFTCMTTTQPSSTILIRAYCYRSKEDADVAGTILTNGQTSIQIRALCHTTESTPSSPAAPSISL